MPLSTARLPSIFMFLLPLTLMAGCASRPAVEPLAIGSQVDFSMLEDQHGRAFTHERNMQTLLFVDSMDGKDLVRDVLDELHLSCLEGGRVVYLADISGMPAIISKLVAVPRMRKYAYPIWLDYTGVATDQLPAEEGAVTYVHLKGAAVQSIDFVDEAETLRARLQPQCGPERQQMAADDARAVNGK